MRVRKVSSRDAIKFALPALYDQLTWDTNRKPYPKSKTYTAGAFFPSGQKGKRTGYRVLLQAIAFQEE